MLWETIDRSGRPVVLMSAVWDHVLSDHLDMAGLEVVVRSAVEHPDFVNRDGRFVGRECLYRMIDDRKLLKVVVAYSDEDGGRRGRVVTAYRTRQVPSKESQLWP